MASFLEILENAENLVEKAKSISRGKKGGKCPSGKRWDGARCVDTNQSLMKAPTQPKRADEPGRPQINATGAGTKDITGRNVQQTPKAAGSKTGASQIININSPAAPVSDPDPKGKTGAPEIPTKQGVTNKKSRRKNPHPEWVTPRLVDELGELHRVSKKEGIRFFDLMHHASAAVSRPDNLEPLDYGHWKNIENTESYSTHTPKHARETARKHGRNLDRVIHGFRTGAKIQAPIVLVRHDGSSTLVSGNTRLMAARAHGIRPKVLMIRMPREHKPTRKDNRESTHGGISKSTIKNLQELLSRDTPDD